MQCLSVTWSEKVQEYQHFKTHAIDCIVAKSDKSTCQKCFVLILKRQVQGRNLTLQCQCQCNAMLCYVLMSELIITFIAILSLFSSLLFCIGASWWRPASTGSLVIDNVIDSIIFWILRGATIKSQMAVVHWEEKNRPGLFIREDKH